MKTTITKDTARNIHRVRQALEAIDKIENDSYSVRPEWRNVAHLEWNGETLAVRSDILSKWIDLAEKYPNRDAYYGKNEAIYFEADDKGEVNVRQGTACLKLCAINQGNIPPIYPIKVSVNGTIDLAFDPQPILDKAKSLSKGKTAAKLAAAANRRERAMEARLNLYNEAKAKLTPEAIACEVKKLKRLRKLSQWLRRDERAMETPPQWEQVTEHPELQMFDPSFVPDYMHASQRYFDTKRSLANFKPRSWRSKGLEQKQKAFNIAKQNLLRTTADAIKHHVRSFGFRQYGSLSIWYVSPLTEAKRTVREYDRNPYGD